MTEPVEQPTSLRTVGRNTGVLFGSQSITWVIAAVLTAVVPRFLGPVGIGQLAVASSLWAIASVFVGLGTSRMLTIESARSPAEAGGLVGPVLRARLICGCLVFVVVFGITVIAGYSDVIVAVAAIAGVAALITSIGEIPRALLVGLERAGVLARADIAGKFLGAIVILALLFATRDVYGVAAANVIAAVLSTLILGRALAGVTTVSYRSSIAEASSAAHRGSVFLLAGMALIAYQQVDTIVMSVLVDEEQIGWYAAADMLFGTLLFAPAILMTALLPALAREHSVDPDRVHAIIGRAFDILLVLAVPVGLLTVLCASPFVVILFGEQFENAGDVLAVFGVVLMFTFFSMLFGGQAAASGRQSLWNVVMILAVGASIVLDLFLVPWTDREFGNGALGGAIAYVVTEGMMVVVGIWRVAPGLMTRSRAVRVAKLAVAGGALLATGMLLRDVFFVVGALAAAVVYLLAIFAMRVLTPDELDALKHVARRGE